MTWPASPRTRVLWCLCDLCCHVQLRVHPHASGSDRVTWPGLRGAQVCYACVKAPGPTPCPSTEAHTQGTCFHTYLQVHDHTHTHAHAHMSNREVHTHTPRHTHTCVPHRQRCASHIHMCFWLVGLCFDQNNRSRLLFKSGSSPGCSPLLDNQTCS